MEAYLAAIGIIALIYILLALGLTLQYGLTGLINFGHVGFFAIGAYTSALLALNGVPFLVSFAAAALLAALAAWELDKVLYEIAYEVRNRPHWVELPLRSLLPNIAAVGPG